MLQRRQFLGSIAAAATWVAAGPAVHSVGAGPHRRVSEDLNWRCDAIQSVGQPPRNRAPVVTGISLDAVGQQLAVVGDDHFVSIYSFADHRFTHFLGEHRDWVRAAQFQPGSPVLFTAGNDRRILRWDAESWSRPAEIASHPAAIISLAFSPGGERLLTAGFEKTARIYNTATGALELGLECSCEDNHATAFSPDGKRVAVGGRDGVIRVWNSADGTIAAEYPAHRQRIRALRFTATGRIVSCGDDQTIRICDPAQPGTAESLERSRAREFDLLLLDDDTLAVARSDNRIAVWSLGQRQELGFLSGHTGTVTCLAADATRIISGSYDTQIRVWHRQLDTALPAVRSTGRTEGWNQKLK